MAEPLRFARLVSLACHDLRTPLATVHGFARTLERVELDEPAARYVAMIDTASEQIGALLEDLALAARIEAGRFDPAFADVDSLALAREAAAQDDEAPATVTGEGRSVRVEPELARRALHELARAARRHGGVDGVTMTVDGADVELAPITPTAAGVVTGDAFRELGPAVATIALEALGATIRLEGETLRVRLPLGEEDAA